MRRDLVSPLFVGRETELATMIAVLESAVAGTQSVVLRCIELGGEGLPFGPLAHAFRALGARAHPARPRPRQRAARRGRHRAPARARARRDRAARRGPPADVRDRGPALGGSLDARPGRAARARAARGERGAGGGAATLTTEVVADTTLQRSLDPAVFARAYGLVVPACVAGIAGGALLAPACVALIGLSATLIAGGTLVLAYGALALVPRAQPGRSTWLTQPSA